MEMKEVALIRMAPGDLDQVLSIEASSSPCPWSEKMFVDELKTPSAGCFVIKAGELPERQIVGFICFRNVGHESELLNIAVHPCYRRLGMGKKLMQFYLDVCRPMRIESFHLEVNASNATAIRLYRLFSYQPAGMRKRFYQGKFDALLMVRETERQ